MKTNQSTVSDRIDKAIEKATTHLTKRTEGDIEIVSFDEVVIDRLVLIDKLEALVREEREKAKLELIQLSSKESERLTKLLKEKDES